MWIYYRAGENCSKIVKYFMAPMKGGARNPARISAKMLSMHHAQLAKN